MSSIEDLINSTIDKEYNTANDTFHDIMKNKMTDALEQQKISIASAVFNDGDVEEEEDIDDEYFEDEELDATEFEDDENEEEYEEDEEE